jgi:hypothetical protein
MPPIIEEDNEDTIENENMILGQNGENGNENNEVPNLEEDDDINEEEGDIVSVIAPPPVNPRISGFNREMRNLQAFFNPNPGGLAAEAAAITFKDDSKKPNFLQKKMTDFFGPITKQAPKLVFVYVAYTINSNKLAPNEKIKKLQYHQI